MKRLKKNTILSFMIVVLIIFVILGYSIFDFQSILNKYLSKQDYELIQQEFYFLALKILIAFAILLCHIIITNNHRRKILENEKERLRISEERYRIIVEQSNGAIFEYNIKEQNFIISDKLREMYPRYIEISQFPKDLFDKKLIHPNDQERLKELINGIKNGNARAKDEFRILNEKGEYFWNLIVVSVMFDKDSKPHRVIGEISDIHKVRKERRLLEKRAKTDFLTGMYNKGTTEEMIEHFLREETNNEEIHAFFIIDIDNFKQINDTYGHKCGDRALSEITKQVKKLFRSSDIIGRIGGDEFVVFIKQIADLEHVEKKAHEICNTIKSIDSHEDIHMDVSSSIGISVYPRDGETYSELFDKADKALYAKKNNGKDGFEIYNPEHESK